MHRGWSKSFEKQNVQRALILKTSELATRFMFATLTTVPSFSVLKRCCRRAHERCTDVCGFCPLLAYERSDFGSCGFLHISLVFILRCLKFFEKLILYFVNEHRYRHFTFYVTPRPFPWPIAASIERKYRRSESHAESH